MLVTSRRHLSKLLKDIQFTTKENIFIYSKCQSFLSWDTCLRDATSVKNFNLEMGSRYLNAVAIVHRYRKPKIDCLSFVYVPATSAAHNILLFCFFLLQPFTVLIKKTRAVKQSTILRCCCFCFCLCHCYLCFIFR